MMNENTAEWRRQSRSSSLSIQRPARGVVVLVVTGTDIGEHGEGPFAELARDVEAGPFELFVDARESRAVALDVSGSWARWLAGRREALVRVNMLTGSRFVELTAAFVRDFAELGERMRVYTDAAAFESALDASTARARLLHV
jgi:hypothetical protein